MRKAEKITKWEAELDSLSCSFRWGETRRFQSNRRVIERREWLIRKISEAKCAK